MRGSCLPLRSAPATPPWAIGLQHYLWPRGRLTRLLPGSVSSACVCGGALLSQLSPDQKRNSPGSAGNIDREHLVESCKYLVVIVRAECKMLSQDCSVTALGCHKVLWEVSPALRSFILLVRRVSALRCPVDFGQGPVTGRVRWLLLT